jgi:glycosyltransferase involved in cell wall biosynthesis
MNIGIVIPGFSSDENDDAIPVQLNLARELARHDDLRVLALRYPHRRDRYTVYGATVVSLGYGAWTRGARRLRLWADAIRTLRQLHTEKPFDVLHAMWADETGLITAWAGRLLRVPVVVSVLGGEFARLHDYGLQRSAFSRWTVRQAVNGADCVLIACAYVQHLMQQTGHRSRQIHTLVLGVETHHFTFSPKPHDPNHLVHAGSLIPVKDQAMLLRALAHLPGITLDIAGDGPERANLEALAARLGVGDRVHFLGAVSHADMPALFARAVLHVLPSQNEGLGMVTLEAAACGVPTVGTAVGLLPDYPALGLTVPVGDDHAFAQAVADLLADESRYRALRRSAHDLVTSRFTIAHTAAELRALYTSLRRKI